jgi:hypothetical protein
VVLAFDDYKYVSSAKSITQANSSKKVAEFNFDQRQDLQPRVPIDFNDLLRNRVYKRKVRTNFDLSERTSKLTEVNTRLSTTSSTASLKCSTSRPGLGRLSSTTLIARFATSTTRTPTRSTWNTCNSLR